MKQNIFNSSGMPVNYVRSFERISDIRRFDKLRTLGDGYLAHAVYSLLFVNDIIDSEIFKLEESLLKAGLMKQSIKKSFKELKAEMQKYTLMVNRVFGDRAEFFADASSRIEDKTEKDLNILYYSILQEVTKAGGGSKAESISRALVIDSLIQTSNTMNDKFKRKAHAITGIYFTNLDYVKLSTLEVKGANLVRYLEQGLEFDLNKSANVLLAYKIFTRKITSFDNVNEALQIDV